MATQNLLGRRETTDPDPEPEVLNVNQAADVLDVLSSTTARHILVTLYDSPAPMSEIAEAVDTSLQNVEYHLDRLTDADLVEVTDTWYSSKGAEMDVYAPSSAPLVLFAGDAEADEMSEVVDEHDSGVAPKP